MTVVFYRPGAIPVAKSYHGRGSGPVFFENVECTGDERSILQCAHKGIGAVTSSACRTHGRDVGVECNPGQFKTFKFLVCPSFCLFVKAKAVCLTAECVSETIEWS